MGALVKTGLSVVLFACGLAAIAQEAPEADLVAELELSAAYNDNYQVTLGAPEEGSAVFAARPNLRYERNASKSLLFIQYRPEILYFEDADDTKVRHSLRALASAELRANSLYFDLGADIAPRFVAQGRQVSATPYNVSPFRRSVQNYSLGPRFSVAVGGRMRLTGQYRYSMLRSSLDEDFVPGVSFRDADSHIAALALRGPLDVLGGYFEARSNAILVNRQGGRSDERVESTAAAVVPVGGGFSAIAEVGYLTTDAARQFDSGLVWRVGLALKGRRTDAELRVGARSGQATYEGRVSYLLNAQLTAVASLSDNVESSQSVQAGLLAAADLRSRIAVQDNNPSALQLYDPRANLPSLGFDFTDRLFRRRRADIAFDYNEGRWTGRLRGFYERRNFDQPATRSSSAGGMLRAAYRVNPRLRVSATGSYRRFRSEGIREDNIYQIGANGDQQLSENLTLRISYDYGTRRSNRDEFDGTEHIIFASLRYRL